MYLLPQLFIKKGVFATLDICISAHHVNKHDGMNCALYEIVLYLYYEIWKTGNLKLPKSTHTCTYQKGNMENAKRFERWLFAQITHWLNNWKP